MIIIGVDDQGDEHLVSYTEDARLHIADALCGCNPDPFVDEDFEKGESKWWWSHHHLGEYDG